MNPKNYSKEVKEFVKGHLLDDPFSLSLTLKNNPDSWVHEAILQIQARKKAKNKLPGWYQNLDLVFPNPISVEQASSEKTAHYKFQDFKGKEAWDLTGGLGIDTWSLSGNFKKVKYVEPDEELCQIAKHNFAELNSPGIEIHSANAIDFINENVDSADLIYIDPSRRAQANKKVFLIEDCTPNVLAMQDALVKKSQSVLIKLSPMLDIKSILAKMKHIKKITVLAIENECKEILCLLQKNSSEVKFEAVNLSKNGIESFAFDLSDEDLKPKYDMPGKYLFVPNASILKAGAFNSLAVKFSLVKLHPNSHLYTSDESIDNFPGRKFKIEAVVKPVKKEIQNLIPSGKANISVRNFPLRVNELRKKLQLTDGGDDYLFATTLIDGSKKILAARQVFK